MKKLGLAIFSCIALVAFMGFSAPALAVDMELDPSCDLDEPARGDGIPGPYNNAAVIHNFKVKTPDSKREHEVSGVEGSGLACGSEWKGIFQFGSYYDNVDVTNPPGVVVNDTSTMTDGSFVGSATVNVINNVLGVIQNQPGVIRTAPIAECAAETPVGGPTPGTIVSCQKTSFAVGNNYNWTTNDAGTYRLTIGPAHTAGRSGPTHIKAFNLCGYVGSTSGGSYPADCGDSSQPWLQKNGDASYGGKGIYTATATTIGGYTTPAAKACVVWDAVTPPSGNRLSRCVKGSKPKVPLP